VFTAGRFDCADVGTHEKVIGLKLDSAQIDIDRQNNAIHFDFVFLSFFIFTNEQNEFIRHILSTLKSSRAGKKFNFHRFWWICLGEFVNFSVLIATN
jgi:hypothetical protein